MPSRTTLNVVPAREGKERREGREGGEKLCPFQNLGHFKRTLVDVPMFFIVRFREGKKEREEKGKKKKGAPPALPIL